nr:transposase [Pseudomonas sp. B3G-3]
MGSAACYLDDGAVPIDNNWPENQIRAWALGCKNWLFAGSLRSGQRVLILKLHMEDLE